MKKIILLICLMAVPILNIRALDISTYTQDEIDELTKYYSNEDIEKNGLEEIIKNELLLRAKDEAFKDVYKEKIESDKQREKYYKLNTFDTGFSTLSTNDDYSYKSAYVFQSWRDSRGNGQGYFVDIPVYEQETSYYCGPASVKHTLQIINGNSEPQSVYADKMETDLKGGTSYFSIGPVLNEYQNRNSYGWRNSRSFTSFIDWYNNIYLKIYAMLQEENLPTIAQVDTQYLYKYNGKKLTHYITFVGYSELNNISYGTPTMGLRYVDSFQADYGRGTTLGVTSDQLYNFQDAMDYLIW